MEDGPSPAKKPKTHSCAGTNGRRQKRGKLAQFMNLPLDSCYEIFGYLTPHDLLNLARTTKQFRKLLMAPSMKPIWERARENVPQLPPCPDDMSEPAYANLVFSPYCHFCSKSTKRNVNWDLRMRMCAICEKLETDTVRKPWPEDIQPIFQMIPTQQLIRRNRVVLLYVLSQATRTQAELDTLDQIESQRLMDVRKQAIMVHKQHVEHCKIWANNLERRRIAELDQTRRERHDVIVSKLTELGWGEEIEQLHPSKALVDHDLVKKAQKLTPRIWDRIRQPLIEYMESARAERLERERNRLIMKRKLAITELFRRYKNTQINIHQWRFRNEILPEPADYLEFDPVRELVHRPGDEEYTQESESLQELGRRLPDLIAEWRSKVDRDFAAHIRACIETRHKVCHGSTTCSHQGKLNMTDNEVDHFIRRATTIFRCRWCTNIDRSPLDFDNNDTLFDKAATGTETKILNHRYILGHHCLTKRTPLSLSTLLPMVLGESPLLDPNIMRSKLSFESIVLDEDYGRAMADVVRAAGRDPESTDHLDLLNRRFYCQTCYAHERVNPGEMVGFEDVMLIGLYNYWEMALHIMEYHRGEPTQPKQVSRLFIKKLKSHDTKNNLKYTDQRKLRSSRLRIWACTHCRDLPDEQLGFTLKEMKLHVRLIHDVPSPTLKRDFYSVYDAECHEFPPFRSFIPHESLRVLNKQAPGFGLEEIDWNILREEQFVEPESEEDDSDYWPDFEDLAERDTDSDTDNDPY